jgi:hypothetical protein
MPSVPSPEFAVENLLPTDAGRPCHTHLTLLKDYADTQTANSRRGP